MTARCKLLTGPRFAAGLLTALAQEKPNPAFAAVEDTAGLARVLLIGDSISIGYTLDVLQYNTVGREVMRRHAIPINDLYEAVRPRLGELQIPDTVHFQREGSRFLAERVAEAIRQALGAP